jgi:hypothetical protein
VTLTTRPRFGSPFSIVVPEDWLVVKLQGQEVDFEQSAEMELLAVYAPPEGGASVVISGRPKFPEGTLQEWMEMMCRQGEIAVENTASDSIGASPVLVALGTQETQELGPTKLIAGLFEDGGVLYMMSGMAAQEHWDSLAERLQEVLMSFRLLEPKGPTVEAAVKPMPSIDEVSYAFYATAETPESFGVDNELNRLNPDNPDERIPSIMEVDVDGRWAALDFPSIDGIVNVPFGWDVNDDGKTGKTFDLEHERVIELRWLPCGADLEMTFQSLLEPLRAKHPSLQHQRLSFEGLEGVLCRGLQWRGRAFEQVILLHDVPTRQGGRLQLTLSAAPGDVERLTLLASLMLRDIRIA